MSKRNRIGGHSFIAERTIKRVLLTIKRLLLGPDYLVAPVLVKVCVVGRLISPRWGSRRFRLALRTYNAPLWGVRVVPDRQTKSRKIPTRKILLALPGEQGATSRNVYLPPLPNSTRREPFKFTPMGVNPISSGSPHVRPMWALSTVVSQTKSRKIPTRKMLPLFFVLRHGLGQRVYRV